MAETTDRKRETREFREEYPSGLMALMKNESIAYILDALLDAPPHREFNQSELARAAGVSRQTVNRHLDLLVGLGVMEEVADTSPTRYRFDPESDVSMALIKLERAINTAGPVDEEAVRG